MRRLWGLCVHAVRFEVNLYVALGRWIARRPAVPKDATPWGYSRLVAPVLWLWVFASAVEMVVVHLITPWATVRLFLLVISIWGLAWMLGLLASYRAYPHLTTDRHLRVRLGKRADIRLDWSDIATVTVVDRDLASSIRTFQPLETADGVDLQVGVSGRANVHVRLAREVEVTTGRERSRISAVTFLVDDPREFARAAGSRLRPSRGPGPEKPAVTSPRRPG